MKLRQMLNTYSSPIKTQVETLCDVIEVLEQKLQENYDEYVNAPLSIEVKKQDGEVTYRANPFVQEYRAMLRDYGQALSKFNELTRNKMNREDVGNLDDLRDKFKINV